MDISLRTKQLNSLFSYDKKTELEESHLEIIPFRFTQTRGASEIDEFQKGLTPTGFCPMTDDRIQENKSFSYAIFTPSGRKKNAVAWPERADLGKIPHMGGIPHPYDR